MDPFKLLDHLPHTVNGVGEELSRGHMDFEPFKHTPVGIVEPKRLLGFLAVVSILLHRR